MMHISKTTKIAFIACGILLLMTTGYVFLYRHITALRGDLDEVKSNLFAIEKLEESKLEISTLLERTKEEREELSKYFVSKDDPTPFLELIETLGSEAGVALSVETLSIDNASSETKVSFQDNMKVVLIVEGEWESLYHFLALIEHMPYIAEITSAVYKIDEGQDGIWKGQVELLCSAK